MNNVACTIDNVHKEQNGTLSREVFIIRPRATGGDLPSSRACQGKPFPICKLLCRSELQSQEKSFPSAANIAWAECSHRKALCRNDLAPESAKVTFVKGKCCRFKGIDAVNDCLATV